MMKTTSISLIVCAALICGAAVPMKALTPAQAQVPGTTPQVELGGAPVELRVVAGKSLLLRSPDQLQRVSITDPNLASALVVSPTQVLINGLVPGSVTLMLWDTQERVRSFNLTVELDVQGLQQVI